MIGKAVSHYTILEKVGGGGDDVVWGKEDHNMNRQMPIRNLPDMLAGDPERAAWSKHDASSRLGTP
jgi:hypothetical protein